jgi:predicted nuclease of restriction endonuclease-like (RecB) superfamily
MDIDINELGQGFQMVARSREHRLRKDRYACGYFVKELSGEY